MRLVAATPGNRIGPAPVEGMRTEAFNRPVPPPVSVVKKKDPLGGAQ
jgi:hypothetical protein